MRAVVALLLVLPVVAPAVADAPAVTLVAGEPEGWRVPLTAEVRFHGRLEAPVTLHLAWTGADGNATWTEAWPDAVVDGNATLVGEFVAPHGPGRYDAVLHVGEGASPAISVAFEAEPSASAETTVTWDGASSTATLTLTSDTVNADGKLKFPGEEVVTRFVAEDPAGLEGDVRVEVRAADGRRVASDRVPLPAGTRAALEHRVAISPLAVGNYTLTLATDASTVARTFTTKDAAAVVVRTSGEPTARAGRTWTVDVTLGDRNLDEAGRAAGALTAKLYRATTAVPWILRTDGASGEGAVALDLADATAADPTWEVEGGLGTVVRTVRVDVPSDAAPAAYRLAVLRASEKIGEATFEVVPPPSVAVRVVAARPGGPLALQGTASGVDAVRLEVSGAVNATVEAPVLAGTFAVNVTLPRGLAAGAALHVRATAEGAVAGLDAAVANAPPEARLDVRLAGRASPARVLPGAVLDVDATADDPNGEAASVRVRLVDVDGREVVSADGVALRIPEGLPRGAYDVEAVAVDAANAAGVARHRIQVGAWVEAGFAASDVLARRVGGGLEATAQVRNTGNVDVGEALLLAGALAGADPVDATLTLPDGTVLTAPIEAGRARFELRWPPGDATLRVRWGTPDDPAERSAPLLLVVRGAS